MTRKELMDFYKKNPKYAKQVFHLTGKNFTNVKSSFLESLIKANEKKQQEEKKVESIQEKAASEIEVKDKKARKAIKMLASILGIKLFISDDF